MAIKTIKQVSGLTKKHLNRKQFTKKQLGGSNNNKWQYLP
jgi:hypothetical protein